LDPHDEKGRWNLILALDEEYLKGDAMLSEWCTFIVKEADTAFANGTFLAAILTTVAGVETYFRSEYAITGKERLFELIENSPISPELKTDIHILRRYRNKWVHIDEPWNDAMLLEKPKETDSELEKMALLGARVLKQTIYLNQGV
jgi:hypothetical protein